MWAAAWLTSNLILIIATKSSVELVARMLAITGITKTRNSSFAISKMIVRYKWFFLRGGKVVMRHVRQSIKNFSWKTHLMGQVQIYLCSLMSMIISARLEILFKSIIVKQSNLIWKKLYLLLMFLNFPAKMNFLLLLQAFRLNPIQIKIFYKSGGTVTLFKTWAF